MIQYYRVPVFFYDHDLSSFAFNQTHQFMKSDAVILNNAKLCICPGMEN